MKKIKNYLLTGATGFIGFNILNKLKKQKRTRIYYVYRDKNLRLKNEKLTGIKINFENLKEIDKLKNILGKIDTVIHCANLAHSKHSSSMIKKVNYSATIHLAKLAKKFKIKKFIFLSTAKINMDYNKNINCETDISPNIKNDVYTKFKYQTEKSIEKILKNSKVNYFILRPALVYGNNVKGNLKKLTMLIDLNLPLPFLNTINKKSFCSINNLIKCIDCILINNFKSNTFIICDNTYYSIKDIVIYLSKLKNKKIILFPIKIFLFKIFFILINSKDKFDSIFSRMILDNSKIKKKFNIDFQNNFYNTKYK
jgi:UDP-glucose 4-epimerase